LEDNNITASQKEMLEDALPSTSISWPDVIIDGSEPAEKTWEEQYEEWIQNPEPYGGVDVLKKIRDMRNGTIAIESTLDLSNQNITDVTPILSGITEIAENGKISSLILNNNNISDLSPFKSFPDSSFGSGFGVTNGGTNLYSLELEFNKINANTDITHILHSAYYIYLQGNDLSDEQKKEIFDTRGQLVMVEDRLY
jgi:hypothetical protein